MSMKEFNKETVLPEWGRYISKDDDGMYWIYSHKPHIDKEGYSNFSKFQMFLYKLKIINLQREFAGEHGEDSNEFWNSRKFK